ncbi:MAG: class I SAM-dependent methyltransferase [Acidobacteria bacterium]|nr:class I SAM-dependent methyltransferase [Acidobacteriota bacterium]
MADVDRATLDRRAASRYQQLESSRVRQLYRIVAQRLNVDELGAQRLKSLYFACGYWRILLITRLSLIERLRLIARFMRVDWNVVHGHRPVEIAHVTKALAARPGAPSEVVVEAGCWRGGSTAKFSIVCAMLGLRLQVYDSFEGVEPLDAVSTGEWNFGGQYACTEETVRQNVTQFGCIDVCDFHKGWFSQTLASRSIGRPVRLAYVDCDLAKGTLEALSGVMPTLAPDGCVFSQDFHIMPVRKMLLDPSTWATLRVAPPRIKPCSVYMVQLTWPGKAT